MKCEHELGLYAICKKCGAWPIAQDEAITPEKSRVIDYENASNAVQAALKAIGNNLNLPIVDSPEAILLRYMQTDLCDVQSKLAALLTSARKAVKGGE